MIYFFTGSDREKARAALRRAQGKQSAVRITDAHTIDDFRSALQGRGMFDETRAIVLDGIFSNAEMREAFLQQIEALAGSDDTFLVYEEKIDAATRKKIEKYAEKTEKFEAPKTVKRGDVFVLASALGQGDKKALWVGYQRALARKEAPEAIHGVLFWGAKQMALSGQGEKAERGRRFVAELAELPHEARRKGFDLEYALEKYILGVNKP